MASPRGVQAGGACDTGALKEKEVAYAVRREETGYLGDGDSTKTITLLKTPDLQLANDAALQTLKSDPNFAAVVVSKKEGLLSGTGERMDLTVEEVYVERVEVCKEK